MVNNEQRGEGRKKQWDSLHPADGQDVRYCLSGNKLSIFGKPGMHWRRRETRTSKERSGWAADTRVEGCNGVCYIGRGFELNILGFERNRLEICSEPIKRPVLDGKVGCEEEEGNQAGGGEERPLLFSEGFGLGCDWERDRDERVLIIKERVFRDAHRETHGGGGGEG